MAELGFTVRVIDRSRFFEEMWKRSKDASRLFLRVGQLLVNASRRSFTEQAYGGKAWPARSTPNVMGVVRDLAEGAAVGEHRFAGRPALIDRGDLSRSVSWTLLGNSAIRVSSSSPYAGLHQNGGRSSLAVTPIVRSNLSIYLRSHPDRRSALGFLFRKSAVSTNVPARPFMGMTPLLNAQITTAVKDFVLQRGEFRRA